MSTEVTGSGGTDLLCVPDRRRAVLLGAARLRLGCDEVRDEIEDVLAVETEVPAVPPQVPLRPKEVTLARMWPSWKKFAPPESATR